MNILPPQSYRIVRAILAVTTPMFVIACGDASDPTNVGEQMLGQNTTAVQTIDWSGNGTADGSCETSAGNSTLTWRFHLTSPSGPTSTLTATFDEGSADLAASLVTNLPNANDDLVLTANTAGTAGNLISIEYRDQGQANAPLSVFVSGNEVVVGLATDAGGALTATASQVQGALNAHPSNPLHADFASGNDGSGIVSPMTRTFLSGGGIGPVINQYTAAGVRVGGGNSPFRYVAITAAGARLLSASATNGSDHSNLNLISCE